MSYDVTNFTDYISRENDVLTATLFAGGDTARFARFMEGVKGSTEVPKVTSSATLQKGYCHEPLGDTDIDLVTLSVVPFTVFEEFCQDDLQTKFPKMTLAPGSNNSDAPDGWEAKIIETKNAAINETLELHYWQGDTAGVTYTLFDGFIKKIDAELTVVNGNLSAATEITKANVRQLVSDMRTAAPAKVKRNSMYTTNVGDDVFDLFIEAEKEANLYHYKPEHDEGIYKIGGSGNILHRVYGLNETNRMFASIGSNFIVGNDVKDEENVFDVWYDKTKDKVLMRAKGKAGVTIDNPEEIVEFTLAV